MSQAADGGDPGEVERLLAGAAATIAKTPFCWLATTDTAQGVSLRPMGRLPPETGDDAWTIRFITDGRSRKASDMRRSAEVTVLFQNGDDAFITLRGSATLREGEAEVGRRWKRAYEPYFPSEQDRANAAFVAVEVERLELWIRGVTPEPFGMRATVLQREAGGAWRLISK
jgi:general stress protein 26